MLAAVLLGAVLYNGLLYPEMGTIANAIAARGQHVEVLWHDQEQTTACPAYIAGHSMGGLAALDQGRRCAAAGKPPRAIVTIDPAGTLHTIACPRGVYCVNFYDPSHVISPGNAARKVIGAHNVIVRGYTHLTIPSAPGVIKGALAATAR
jgi:pimeloyl-ACP methyl ester carboxylesterase